MASYLTLLLAVTTFAQDTVAPAPAAGRKYRRAPVLLMEPTAIPPVTAAPMALPPMTVAPMTITMPELPAIRVTPVMPELAAVPNAPLAIEVPQARIMALFGDDWDNQDQQEPADSLYRAGRRALNRNRYQEAITAFGQVVSRYPRSSYAPHAMYWSSFALYRTGDTKNLQAAVNQLSELRKKYPDDMARDAQNLAARIDGELAQRGDAEAAQRNQARADSARSGKDKDKDQPRRGGGRRDRDGEAPPGCEGFGEDDPKMIALGALLQMNAESAIPILRDVLKRRDPCSVIMRRKAVWIVSQKRTPETARILLDAVRNDPDKEVREQAVFWLSQVPGEETVTALDSVLSDPKTDPEIQEKAIFALSQHRSARAGGILRAFAERRDVSSALRENAIFWLGQKRSPENAEFLRSLFAKVETKELKEKVIFSLSQMGGTDNYRWLMDIALNQNEDIEIRKNALFWAGQGRSVDIADLVRLYDSMKDREMKDQLIFLYSQRRDEAALEKLFDIGKNDPDRELRKKAIFWIGQSRSPRAAQYLQELINQ